MDLILFGIQGSGKGTQAKRLAAEFGYQIFEAGGALRRIASEGTDLGRTVKSYIDQGKLVPHEIIMRVAKESVERMRAEDADVQILFDGIPRDADQKRDFDAMMQSLGREFRCIHLKLDPQAATERILGRAKVEGRADDADIGAIQRRMGIFQEKTLPIIREYGVEGRVVEVDGSGSMDQVYELLSRAVSS